MLQTNKIYCGHNIELLGKIKPKSISLILTSPPYDSLRDYETCEFALEEYLINFLETILIPGGVIVWVVGDQTIKGSETGTSFRQALSFMKAGFKLHDTMIYEKHNFANPSINRYHQIFEYMFVFTKGKLKTFNPIKDKKNKMFGQTNWGRNTIRLKDGSLGLRPKKTYAEFGMRTNIWRFVTGKQSNDAKLAYQHPAIFPIELAEDHIKSWTNENDTVLDPFNGSGTTCVAAKKLKRQYIGIDISEKYCKIAEERLALVDKINDNK